MARLPRFFIEGQPQHLIQRGNNRAPIFAAEDDYRFYLEALAEASERYGCEIYAYVLMTNHVHLLVAPQTELSLPKTLQSVGRRYVQHFNRAYERTGTLWEGRYRATLIDSERYLLTCMRYIELNPVRAGMVRHPRDYLWSSYRSHADGESDPLVQEHPLYRRLGRSAVARQAAYRQLFRAQIAQADLEAIRQATNKAWALGDVGFREKMAALTGRRTAPLAKGRRKLQGN
jgi:putative transposase